jgi:hypothetical protein
MAGCHAQHQQTAFAKKKRQEVVFFVKTAPRASADPRLAFFAALTTGSAIRTFRFHYTDPRV